MFEYKVDNITIYNTAAFDIKIDGIKSLGKRMAVWIVDHLEQDIIEDILDRNYEGFSKNDKIFIIENAISVLDKSKEMRKIYIEEKIDEYLRSSSIINVPGFVRFRLKSYKKKIEIVIDEVIDRYLCEREYYDFIQMIKEYIQYQRPLISVLHIVSENKSVKYFDKYFKEITEMLEKEYSFETDLSPDDKLLTILVLSAPEKIIWHNSDKVINKQLKSTIKEIFEERLVLCDNCKICNNMEN